MLCENIVCYIDLCACLYTYQNIKPVLTKCYTEVSTHTLRYCVLAYSHMLSVFVALTHNSMRIEFKCCSKYTENANTNDWRSCVSYGASQYWLIHFSVFSFSFYWVRLFYTCAEMSRYAWVLFSLSVQKQLNESC